MIVTESSWVNPIAYQSEGPFLIAVYQSLSGMDAFIWFMATQPEYALDPTVSFVNLNGQHPLFKWSASIPAIMGGFPAAALMFRMGYIQQGAPVVHEERTISSLWNRDPPIIAEDRSFDPNRDRGHAVGSGELKTGADPLAFLVGPVEVKFDGDPAKSRVVDLSRYIDNQKKVVRSITGEVTFDYGGGLCTVDTPESPRRLWIPREGQGDPAVAISPSVPITATRLSPWCRWTKKPLALSRKILVQVGTSARPDGWKTRTAEFPGEDGKTMLKGFQILSTGTRTVADREHRGRPGRAESGADESNASGYRRLSSPGSSGHPRRQ